MEMRYGVQRKHGRGTKRDQTHKSAFNPPVYLDRYYSYLTLAAVQTAEGTIALRYYTCIAESYSTVEHKDRCEANDR